MSGTRRFIFIFCFLVIDIFLIGSLFFIKDITYRNILTKEVNSLASLNFNKDTVDLEIKSIDKYAIVEKAIKQYLDDYIVETKNIFGVIDVEKIDKFLTISNYMGNKKYFDDSIEYLNSTKLLFNENIDLLLDRVNEKMIDNYIYRYVPDEESINLYYHLLSDSNLINKINNNQFLVQKRQNEINKYIDSISEVLIFLRDNINSYTISNNKIIFNNENLAFEYNKLMEQVKRI